jgi:hypothetical protein
METSENEHYYNDKQIRRLESFKNELKIIKVILVFGIGYWSYEHNHFTTFIITTFIVGFYYFLYKLFSSIGKRNEEYNKAHKDIEKK